MSNIHPTENSYIVDQESAAEMARLLDQDLLITRHMGGLFPADLDLSRFHDILDVASGPGGWVQEVAFSYPDKQVVGIDISNTMLAYARSQASVQGLSNARFLPMDVTEPLQFPDATFDMINSRFLMGFMWKEAWQKVVNEYARITRPGGIIRLTETDTAGLGLTNSAATEKMHNLLMRGFFRTGRSFYPEEGAGHIALTPRLRDFLENAGCHSIHEQPHAINYSYGTRDHASMMKNWQVGMKLVQPFLTKLKLATQQELDEIYQTMLYDMAQKDFKGIWYIFSAYGQKST